MSEITTRKLSSNTLEVIKQHIAKKTEILKKNVDLDNIEEIGTLLDTYKNKINTFGKIIENEKNKIIKETNTSIIKNDVEEILDEDKAELNKDNSKNIDNSNTLNHHLDKNKILNNVNVFKGCSVDNATNTNTVLDNKNSNNSKELI